MSDVDIELVREFFELNLFSVMTHWQHDAERPRLFEPGSQLFVENTDPSSLHGPPEFVLSALQVSAVERAVVEVRAWHAERFYASVVEAHPTLGQFVEGDAGSFARYMFGTPEFDKILVISELPASAEPRKRSLELIEEMGITHVLEFGTVLRGMLDKISANGNYPSPTLRVLRLLKRYGLVRRQQLEFAFSDQGAAFVTPQIDSGRSTDLPDEE